MWSLTINNPVEADYEAINLVRQRGWVIVGQVERGEAGTYHLQLALKTPQVRFSAVKKMFPRAHIEVARNPAALLQYVSKSDTRVAQLPQSSELYPSLSKLWTLIYQIYDTDDKYGWDLCSTDVCPYNVDDHKVYEEAPLKWFDQQIHKLIQEGYHVETMAVNPQVRATWKLYHQSIMNRTRIEEEARVEIPTVLTSGENITNAAPIHPQATTPPPSAPPAPSSPPCSP